METISSLAKGMTNHPKREWFCSCDSIFVCTTVELEKNYPRHSVNCAIHNVADDGLLLIAPMVLEATLRPEVHRFNLSLYLLQS